MKPHQPSLSVSYNKDIKGIPKPENVLPVFTIIEPYSLTSSLMNLGLISMGADNIDSNLSLLSTIEHLINDYMVKNIDSIIDEELNTLRMEDPDLIALAGLSAEEDLALRLDIDTRQLLGANVATANQKRDKDFKSAIDAAQSQKRAREKDHSMTGQEINDQQIRLKTEYSEFKARSKDTASNFSEVARNYIYSGSDYYYAITNEMFYIYVTNRYVEPSIRITKNIVWRHFAEQGCSPFNKSSDTINSTSFTIATTSSVNAMISSLPDTDNDFMTEVFKRIDAARRSSHSYRNHLY